MCRLWGGLSSRSSNIVFKLVDWKKCWFIGLHDLEKYVFVGWKCYLFLQEVSIDP